VQTCGGMTKCLCEPGVARCGRGDSARPDCGPGGTQRLRQVHHNTDDPALLRPGTGNGRNDQCRIV